ncbi:MAG: helix-turn-helix transcriptional regulator [Leptolyngbya sp.]|nr:helix-turn-helix transcriptional regulator [Leptolyngbya sp.]
MDDFPHQVMTALLELIHADSTEVISFNLHGESSPCVLTFPQPSIDAMAAALTAQPDNVVFDAVATHNFQVMDRRSVSTSVFLAEAKLHLTKLLDTEFLSPSKTDNRMGIYLELPSSLKKLKNLDPFHRGQEYISLMLRRDQLHFTERDRLVLTLIQPHLQQAYETHTTFHQVHYHLAQQQAATDLVGLIALSTEGNVQWITQKAREILRCYFPSPPVPMTLPDLLQRWVNRYLAMFLQREGSCQVVRPLQLQQEGKRLTIRWSYGSNNEQLYLLLEETEQESISIESLQLLGLTKREAEVLFWIAKDKSLVELAKILSISDRTVKKHLEHIYEKFGVQTRLAAVMYALEHLGILS